MHAPVGLRAHPAAPMHACMHVGGGGGGGTWWRSMSFSLWRLYSLSATVMPVRLSTAWYTMLMAPLYISLRNSKSSRDLYKGISGTAPDGPGRLGLLQSRMLLSCRGKQGKQGKAAGDSDGNDLLSISSGK